MSAVKEADVLKHAPNRVMAQLQKKDHAQLWSGLVTDKFDQFWAVNRKLMDSDAKHIPFRVHWPDLSVSQRLVRAKSESGQWTTFGDLVSLMGGTQWRWVVQGVEPPWDTPLQWMSRHLSHCDNFVHVLARDTC